MNVFLRWILAGGMAIPLFIASGQRCFSQQSQDLTFTLHASSTHQEIDNFGASDCWSARFVGTWPDAKRNAIADLLFSMETDGNGTPKGIGLSAWRFNIGGGSADQGVNSGIRNPWRMGETFVTPDGAYDWNKLPGQRWFLRAAKARGVEHFIGFVNSPPHTMTKNGNTYGDTTETSNLAPARYPEFCRYLCDVVRAVRDKDGVELDYLSPVNEPQVRWSRKNNQEGSFYRNSDIAALVRELDRRLTAEKINARIIIPEASAHPAIIEPDTVKRYNSDQLAAFWGTSPDNIAHVATLAPVVASHDYFTTWPVSRLVDVRRKIGAAMRNYPGLKFWATEYCLLGTEGVEPRGKDLGMETALYVARIIHFNLTLANASAWQWWLAISPGNYKDGLVYVDRGEQDGRFEASKLLWTLGNYSRFVRPGARRVDIVRQSVVDDSVTATDVMVSAFMHRDDKRLVVVAINYSPVPRSVRVNVEEAHIAAFTPYFTTGAPGDDLRRQPDVKAGDTIVLPPRSVVTLTAGLRE